MRGRLVRAAASGGYPVAARLAVAPLLNHPRARHGQLGNALRLVVQCAALHLNARPQVPEFFPLLLRALATQPFNFVTLPGHDVRPHPHQRQSV